MVAQEHRPLAVLGNLRRLPQDLDDGMTVFLPHRHEHARHEREVEGHVALVALAEVRPHVGRPLVGFGEEHAIGIAGVERAADLLEHVVRLLEVLADRPFALDQVRHRVEPQPVDAAVQPELHHAVDRPQDLGVVEIEVRLVMEEAVPVVRLGGVVPAPVRGLGVGEDDADAVVLPVGLAPDVELALRGAGGRPPRRLEPWVLVGGVVDDELGDDANVAAMRFRHEALEVLHRPVVRMDVLVVGDVVAVVPERRRIEGQQPERVDAEALEVVEPLCQAGEVADAVVVAVEEGAHVHLVDDGVLVPEGVFGVGHVNCQLPSSKYQGTPNGQRPSQRPTIKNIPTLGLGRWECLGTWPLVVGT